jgi:hypothetical protein
MRLAGGFRDAEDCARSDSDRAASFGGGVDGFLRAAPSWYLGAGAREPDEIAIVKVQGAGELPDTPGGSPTRRAELGGKDQQ